MTDSSTESRVSIIVPTCNYGRFIADCLNSVRNQTYTNWECWIIDNGSTDDTPERVRPFLSDARFHYFPIKHTSTSGARNAGIRKSSGAFIQFLDADDMLASDKLRRGAEALRNDATLGLIYGSARYFDDGNFGTFRYTKTSENTPWIPEYTGDSTALIPVIMNRNVFVISSPLFRRSVLNQTGLFRDALNWTEDWEFYIRILASGIAIAYDGDDGSHSFIRVHASSLSQNTVRMFQHGALARSFADNTLKALENRTGKSWTHEREDNLRQQVFMYKKIFNLIRNTSSLQAFPYLWKVALRQGDIKLIVKYIIALLRGNAHQISLPE